MTAQLLDGRIVSDFLLKQVRRDVTRLNKKRVFPKLSIILVGEDPSSLSYIRQKERASQKVGILCDQINLPTKTTTEKLVKIIEKLNKDASVHGILVQLPLPKHIQTPLILRAIDPNKDVDGFHAYNIGKMFISAAFEGLAPCTPCGIIKLLEYYKISLASKAVTIVGRSNIVGKPLAIMLTNRDATVTLCHSKTKNLTKYTANADILVAAVGRPRMIKVSMVKKGATIIDVGTTKSENKLVGDVDFDRVKRVAKAITPVPGGVGPMTVACLMMNVVKAAGKSLK